MATPVPNGVVERPGEHFAAAPHGRKLTPREAAERLGLSEKTLAQWRWLGIGPAYRKASASRVGYMEDEIERFDASRTFSSTSHENAVRAREVALASKARPSRLAETSAVATTKKGRRSA